MQRLGEILIEKGVLSISELHTALETCHRSGARLGTQLLEFGYVDERVLLEALAKQLSVPSVIKVKLLHSPLEVRRMLPSYAGRRLQAVPFENTKRGIKVAMTNPNDRAALDEIKIFIKQPILPHVATEAAVLAAIEGAEADDGQSWTPDPEISAVKARRSGDDEGWSRLWEVPRFDPVSLLKARDRTVPQHEALLALYPSLDPVFTESVSSFEPQIDDENFSEFLNQAEHRDDIGAIIARYAASLYDRVCLFSVHKDVVSGWMARGRSVTLEDLQTFSVPLDRPSLFSDMGHADSYVGAILENAANNTLMQVMAEPAPTEVVLVPVRVKKRVVAFVLCDDPGHSAAQEHVDNLVVAGRKAGVAFEVLIMRKKILS
jgi:hypothetical protein